MFSLTSILGEFHEEEYIYLEDNMNMSPKLDLLVHWVKSPGSAVKIRVNTSSSLTKLRLKITEEFERFSVFRGLLGFRIASLKFRDREVPLKGCVGDYFRQESHIYCDFTSDDLWIDSKVDCPGEKVSINFTIKARRTLTMDALKSQCHECASEILRSINKSPYESLISFKKHKQLKLSQTVDCNFDFLSRKLESTLVTVSQHDWSLTSTLSSFDSLKLPFVVNNISIQSIKRAKEATASNCMQCSLL